MKGSSYARMECQSPHPCPSPTREGSCLTAGEGEGTHPRPLPRGSCLTAGEGSAGEGAHPRSLPRGSCLTAGEKARKAREQSRRCFFKMIASLFTYESRIKIHLDFFPRLPYSSSRKKVVLHLFLKYLSCHTISKMFCRSYK